MTQKDQKSDRKLSVRVGDRLYEPEFGTVVHIERSEITVRLQNGGSRILLNSSARKIRPRGKHPTFLSGTMRLHWFKEGTAVVVVSECGLWGFRRSYDEALERLKREEETARVSFKAPEIVQSDPLEEVLPPAQVQALGSRQVAKFYRRYERLAQPTPSAMRV